MDSELLFVNSQNVVPQIGMIFFGSFAKKLKVEIGYPVQGVKKHTSDLSQLW
jgi:hypothetical protein